MSDTAKGYLGFMLIVLGINLMGQSVNTTVLDGIFCAGGDAKFDMKGNIGAMWCFAVPLGFIAAFVFNPATYTGVFSDIRNLFVGLPEAKIRSLNLLLVTSGKRRMRL